MILQSNPAGKNILNFQNYISLDVNTGLKKGYIDTFNKLMESLIRTSKKHTQVLSVSWELSKERIKLKDILIETIDDCKKVSTSTKKILKDNLFYMPKFNK